VSRRSRFLPSFVVVAGAVVACGGESDPAFAGTYPCSPACASDEVCVLDQPGLYGAAPLVGCVPMGFCTSTPLCDCLGPLCADWSLGGQCGVSPSGYVVECHGA
jgi:hypothetical protein